MMFRIKGIEEGFELKPGIPTSLDIENQTFFAQILNSLINRNSDDEINETCYFFEGNNEVKFSSNFIVVQSPLDLPFKSTSLVSLLFSKIDNKFKEDDDLKNQINDLYSKLNSSFEKIGIEMYSDYSFDLELNIKKCLKTFGYSANYDFSLPLIDNLIAFLEFVADVASNKVLLFVNLKHFLSVKDYLEFCKQCFFLNLKVLIVNSGNDLYNVDDDLNYVIDQNFLVFTRCDQLDVHSSSQ